MTQNRRRSTPGGGSRRPQVAGLRKPSPRPRPTPEPRHAAPDADAVADEPSAPRPRAKAREEGSPKPESADETVSQPSALPDRTHEPQRAGEGVTWTMTSIVAAIALVLALAAAFFAFKYFSVSGGGENQAMVDVVATQEVKEQVADNLETMFSYDYRNVGQHEQAVKDALATDEMRRQYEQLMGDVKEKAPQQGVILQTTVRNIAVISMDEDSAKVVAFIDQTSIRRDTGQSAATGDQPTVTAVRVDGEWKISHIDAYADPSNNPG